VRISYYPETDSLYIYLADRPGAESKEASEGVVLDYDAKGHLVGIDNASRKLDLKKLTLTKLPTERLRRCLHRDKFLTISVTVSAIRRQPYPKL
jgi:uncharacterized protein YuzE